MVKTKIRFGFGALDPIFKITEEFSLKVSLEPVDGFQLTRDRLLEQAEDMIRS